MSLFLLGIYSMLVKRIFHVSNQERTFTSLDKRLQLVKTTGVKRISQRSAKSHGFSPGTLLFFYSDS